MTTTILTAPKTPLIDWSENVDYDSSGALWVSRTADSRVDRLDANGDVTASISVPFPGAVRSGPDHKMYVNSFLHIVGGPGLGRIYRFDPVTLGRPSVFASGLGFPNGLAFDKNGYAYVSDSALGVTRIRPDGSVDTAWSWRAPKSLLPSTTVDGVFMNGATVVGDNLYVTMTESLTGRILRIPLDAPGAASVAADLTAPLPGIIDDLVPFGKETLAAAGTTGQVFFADMRSGKVCSSDVGQPITALAVDPARPNDLIAGTELGSILRLRVAPER